MQVFVVWSGYFWGIDNIQFVCRDPLRQCLTGSALIVVICRLIYAGPQIIISVKGRNFTTLERNISI
jgi:hypothetical protein